MVLRAFGRRAGNAARAALLGLVSVALALALTSAPAVAEGAGLLWKERPETNRRADAGGSSSMMPVVLAAAAGGVLGIEIAVVGVGAMTGSSVGWWVLGGAGAVVGATAGAVLGEIYLRRHPPEAVPPTAVVQNDGRAP